MANILLASMPVREFWYAIPLIVAVSLVYAATRHELMAPIMSHAVRIGVWIVGFMAIIVVVLAFTSWLV